MEIREINPTIIDKLIEVNIPAVEQHNALLYLLGVYFNIDTSSLPENVIRHVNMARICTRNFDAKGGHEVTWNVPLFITEVVPDDKERAWEWVDKEYRTLFKEILTTKAGDKKGVIGKMKKFFSENPEVRKSDIINATLLYIASYKSGADNPKYMLQADYFISKRQPDGTTASKLSQYLERIRESEAVAAGNNSRFKVTN